MPAKTKFTHGAIKAGQAASAAGANPYIRRIIEDEQLRSNMVNAFAAARGAYRRMSNGKRPAKAIAADRKLQRDLKEAAESLKMAADQLRGKPKRRRKGSMGRKLLVLAVGAGLVLVFSESARRVVMDRLFGAEEEFEYSSVTTPSGNGA